MNRKKRKRQTLDENVEFFCKRNHLMVSDEIKNNIKQSFEIFSDSFSSKTKLCEYIKYFIKYDLKYWKQRLKRLSFMNLKGVTKKKFLLLYGKNETIVRWKNYLNLQSKTNTYEYKKEKYGWTEDDYVKYNKSRSVTIDNMVKKYGEEFGKIKYLQYVEKQKYSGCSLEYFVEKYGEISGTIKYYEICKLKALNLDNFIRKYGEDLGRKKYRDYCEIRPTFHSKISQELFWKIKTDDCYFAEYNKEFGLNSENGYYFYDYVDSKLKKCIEFNGDYWHCNPKIYTEDYKTHYNYTARDIWKKDEEKINFIKSKKYDVMIVWESEYLQNPDKILKEVGDFLYDKN